VFLDESKYMVANWLQRHPRFVRVFSFSWYISLIVSAGIMLIVLGDPSAALVLAIVLPLSCLISTRRHILATTSAIAVLVLAGSYLSTRMDLDSSMRSAALGLALAAPAIGLLAAIPTWMARMVRPREAEEVNESMELSVTLENQSSTKFMSDSIAIGSLGRLTPETNRSRAA
jgi:hypothetical protein